MRDLPHQICRLLEMHADDLAACTQDPETLAEALVAVATARPALSPSNAPPGSSRLPTATGCSGSGGCCCLPARISPRRRRMVRGGRYLRCSGCVPEACGVPAAGAGGQSDRSCRCIPMRVSCHSRRGRRTALAVDQNLPQCAPSGGKDSRLWSRDDCCLFLASVSSRQPEYHG
jgi:hypothetical protein